MSSGLSNLPGLLAYPRIPTLKETKDEIRGQLVYVIKGYKEDGLAVLIIRDKEEVFIKFGDFDGNLIDVTEENHPYHPKILEIMGTYSSSLIEMMKLLGIDKLLFYIAIDGDSMVLIDLRASLDKFYGPGMIRDLFSKVFPIQETIKVTNMTDEAFSAIYNNEGSFSGNIVLKCSKFKTVARGKELLPLYAKIDRDNKNE